MFALVPGQNIVHAQELVDEVPAEISETVQPLLPEDADVPQIQKDVQDAAETADLEMIEEPVTLPDPEILEEEPVVELPDLPAAQPVESEFDEDLFFDAEDLAPSTELSNKGAPSKVNPNVSPGSRLVVTRKTSNAGSRKSRLIAAERASKLGRFESALEIYNGLYAQNARDPNILMGRAVSLQRLGRDEEAIGAYEELLDIRPRFLEAQINLQGLISKRYPAVALRNLLELFEDNPGNTAIVAQVAVVEAQMGRYAEAIRFLGIAASMEPENANHVFNMAVIADRAGDKDQAIKFYEEALEIDTLYGASRSVPRDSIFQRLAELR